MGRRFESCRAHQDFKCLYQLIQYPAETCRSTCCDVYEPV